MTREEAEQLGYRVIKASPFEVGLVKGDEGLKTWWCSNFNRKLPDLGHPKILEAVAAHEALLVEFPPNPTIKAFVDRINDSCGGFEPIQSIPLYDLLCRELKDWRSPEQVAKMTREYKHLLGIYTIAAHTLGMQPDDNFHALDRLAADFAAAVGGLLREARAFRKATDGVAVADAYFLDQAIDRVEAVVKYSGPGRFFSSSEPESPSQE